MFSRFFIERPIFASVISIVIVIAGGVTLLYHIPGTHHHQVIGYGTHYAQVVTDEEISEPQLFTQLFDSCYALLCLFD